VPHLAQSSEHPNTFTSFRRPTLECSDVRLGWQETRKRVLELRRRVTVPREISLKAFVSPRPMAGNESGPTFTYVLPTDIAPQNFAFFAPRPPDTNNGFPAGAATKLILI